MRTRSKSEKDKSLMVNRNLKKRKLKYSTLSLVKNLYQIVIPNLIKKYNKQKYRLNSEWMAFSLKNMNQRVN